MASLVADLKQRWEPSTVNQGMKANVRLIWKGIDEVVENDLYKFRIHLMQVAAWRLAICWPYRK
jgi:hypothetical protein